MTRQQGAQSTTPDTSGAPGSPEWMRKVTASKVAAILGLSPWDSPRSMWHKMHGDLPNDDGSNVEAKARGHYLESGVVAWWLDQHPNVGETATQAHLTYGEWGAATPDLIGDDDGYGNEFVMDAKTANDDDHWGDEPPAYYLAQSYWQLACHPSADIAYIAALFGRPRLGFREYPIQRDEALIAAIVERCRAFYDSLALDTPPPLDDHPATYEAIRKLHPDIDREASVELTEDEARDYLFSKGCLDFYESTHRAAKAVVLDRMGKARIAAQNGQTIARRQPNKYGISLVAVAKTIDTEGNTTS